MSNHLTSLAYKVDVETLLRKAVLVLLADKASDDGSGIWASKQTLADELNCSKQGVINTIQQFVNEGLLVEVEHRPHANGFTWIYSLDVAKMAALPRVRRWLKDQSIPLTGQPGVPVHPVDPTSQPGVPKPSLTPLTSGAKAPSVGRAKPKMAETALPDDFVVPEEWIDMAVEEHGWHRRDAQLEGKRFVDHALMNDRRCKNWKAAFRNWGRMPFCATPTRENKTAYRNQPITMA